jgi:hypothetical protein
MLAIYETQFSLLPGLYVMNVKIRNYGVLFQFFYVLLII